MTSEPAGERDDAIPQRILGALGAGDRKGIQHVEVHPSTASRAAEGARVGLLES